MQIHVALQDKVLWRKFDAHQNEMIITKCGRNLFPILEFAFKGLSEHSTYQIGITMEAINYSKLKFTGGRWETLDAMEEMIQSNEVFFVKTGIIRVQSMRQYMPVLNVYEVVISGALVQVGKFQFHETKFIAVTAYQSDFVKRLKVAHNKFAQGFREGVKGTSDNPSLKRPLSTTSSHSSPDSSLSTHSSDIPDNPKKGRSQELQYPQYYQFPMHGFPGYPGHFQGFESGFDGAAYWNPQNPMYDFGNTVRGHSHPYGYQWN
uniref:T-box domain-containing protein n=1 Tax=Caenorhabditis tropicalis TaxID=1561998 RepID=A0A1I7UMA1_9PELO